MKNTCALLCATVLAAACGGGGDSAPAPAPAPSATYDLNAALTSALSTGVSFSNLHATLNGVTYTLNGGFTPTTDGTLLGANFKRATETLTISQGATPIGTEITTLYYSLSPARVNLATTSGGELLVYQPKADLPTAASVGQSGALYTGTEYASPTISAVLATFATTWSLEADTNTTAWACLTTTTNAAGSASTAKLCLRTSPSGALSGAKLTTTVNGVAVTFQ
jgi:hypothetical protein